MASPTLYLRIAAVLTLIHCILHTVGGVFGAPPEHSVQAAVFATMKDTPFPTMGVVRSYWDFNLGYGLVISTTLLAESILFWQFAAFAKGHPALVRPLLVTFIFYFFAFAVFAARYFFLAPAITEVIIAILLILAFWAAGRQRSHAATYSI